jgi:hypothetical protein
MDLDLLLYGDAVGSGPGYTLPRRDLARRSTCSGRWPSWRRSALSALGSDHRPAVGAVPAHRAIELTALQLDLNAA